MTTMEAQLQPITMPKWGMTMTEGRLSAWLVKEGERIATGQEIMEVETEKITNVVEGHVSGLLRRIVVEGRTDDGIERMTFANRPGCPEL
ncbi:MAG: hypothetical protein J0I23_16690 [Rhizobiales bacterium]|nr:hypothetical protein [Hyphomicrobiales bacterium]